MKEINKILKAYDQLDLGTKKVALATVVGVRGSSYRREGARMLITDDGQWTGGISGGCLEGDALRKAQQAIFQQKARVVTYNTTEDDPYQIGVGLGCRGIIDVFIEPIKASDQFNGIRMLNKFHGQKDCAVLVLVTDSKNPEIEAGSRYFLKSDGSHETNIHVGKVKTDISNLAQQALKAGQSSTVTISGEEDYELTVFVEILRPPIELILFGSNYDVLPLLEIGNTLGWNLTLVGDMQKLPKSSFEIANVVPSSSIKLDGGPLPLTDYSAAILMSHDYATDLNFLKKMLNTGVPYIGVLGPKDRTNRLLEDLKKEGIEINEKDKNRIHGPVGLDIGATTPEGIALSIVSEILAFFSKRKGGFLRDRLSPIYDTKAR